MNRKHAADSDQTSQAETVEEAGPAKDETGVRTPEDSEVALSETQPEQTAEEIHEEIESLRVRAGEREQYLQMLQRAQADFENYRKRTQREMETERRYAVLPLVRDLLPVVDNVERALESARTSEDFAKLIEGIELVRVQLLDALARHGVEPLEAVGRPFDPNLHDAMFQRPDAGQPDRTVLEEMERGYQMHERVVRPSKVIVSAQREPDAAAQGDGTQQSQED